MLALEILRPAAARSFFEKFGQLMAWRTGARGEQVLKPTTCPQEMADALLQSEGAARLLPRVQGLINCPVLREVGGELGVAGKGYDAATRLLVTAGESPVVVPLKEAVQQLMELLVDFEFQSDGDKARALASMLTPALKVWGHQWACAGGCRRGRPVAIGQDV